MGLLEQGIVFLIFCLNIGRYQATGSAVNLFASGFVAGVLACMIIDSNYESIVTTWRNFVKY